MELKHLELCELLVRGTRWCYWECAMFATVTSTKIGNYDEYVHLADSMPFWNVVSQLSAEDCEQRMKEVPLWKLAPDRKSIFRAFVAKSFAEGELLIVLM